MSMAEERERDRRRRRLFPEERTGYRSGDPTFQLPDAGGGPPPPGKKQDDDAPICDLCGGRMIDRHCKLSCTQCGYQRDCSDP